MRHIGKSKRYRKNLQTVKNILDETVCVCYIIRVVENKVEYPLSPEHKFTVPHGLIPQRSHMRI